MAQKARRVPFVPLLVRRCGISPQFERPLRLEATATYFEPRAIAPSWVICYELGKAVRRFGRGVPGGRVAEDKDVRHAYETFGLYSGPLR